MKKYILYSFLTIFAFSDVSFGMVGDEEDIPPNVLKIRGRDITWAELVEAGRPGGLSPQTHQNSKRYFSPLCTRGKTFYISEKKLKELFPRLQ